MPQASTGTQGIDRIFQNIYFWLEYSQNIVKAMIKFEDWAVKKGIKAVTLLSLLAEMFHCVSKQGENFSKIAMKHCSKTCLQQRDFIWTG